jgi:hypothetical protein
MNPHDDSSPYVFSSCFVHRLTPPLVGGRGGVIFRTLAALRNPK